MWLCCHLKTCNWIVCGSSDQYCNSSPQLTSSGWQDTLCGKPDNLLFYNCKIFLLGFPGPATHTLTRLSQHTWLPCVWRISHATFSSLPIIRLNDTMIHWYNMNCFPIIVWCNASCHNYYLSTLSRNRVNPKFLFGTGYNRSPKKCPNFSKNYTKEENKVHLK